METALAACAANPLFADDLPLLGSMSETEAREKLRELYRRSASADLPKKTEDELIAMFTHPSLPGRIESGVVKAAWNNWMRVLRNGPGVRIAMLAIDLQVDFLSGGNLAVPNGEEVIDRINSVLRLVPVDVFVLSGDSHPPDHCSFFSNIEQHQLSSDSAKPALLREITFANNTKQTLWPDHCVDKSPGQEFSKKLHLLSSDIIVKKGMDSSMDSYSAFNDNNGQNPTILHEVLKKAGITHVFVFGLALDYCVKFTALDAIKCGYKTYVVADACRGINADPQPSYDEMTAAGVTIVETSEEVSAIVESLRSN
jgi:nicotinamidase/pyrazinamidase